MASSLMSVQTTIYRPLLHHHPAAIPPSRTLIRATPSPPPFHLRLKSSATIKTHSSSKISASSTLQNPPLKSTLTPPRNVLHGPTRTATTLLATALALSKLVAGEALALALPLKQPLLQSIGPAFFAAIKDAPAGSLNTPLTVVAAGMAKWLDLYSTVLTVRILLSWFPNIPWDRQPLSAIRDLCDPYLNLFRNIIPPIFDTLDVSPLLAFAVLGTLGSILNSSRRPY